MNDPATSLPSTDEPVYVYAILPAGKIEPLPVVGIDEARPVYTVKQGSLQVVVSRVRTECFSWDVVEANLQDREWLETHVRAHQRVLDHLVAGDLPLIPMRFCTLYRTEAAVQAVLSEHVGPLLAELDRLRDKQEWGVQMSIDGAALREAILSHDAALEGWTGDGDIQALQARIDRMPAGGAFLLRKKLDAAVAERAEAVAFALADDSHARLSGHAVEAVTNPLPSRSPEVYLNAAYLVLKDQFAGFQNELGQLAQQYGPAGARYQLSGPWPASHFLSLELRIGEQTS